jgi:Glycosyltransferase family 87
MVRGRLSSTASRRRLAYGALLTILLTGLAAKAILAHVSVDTWDFDYFYRAAQAMWSGQDIYAASDAHYIYPPFLAFLFQPFVAFSERTAALIWTVISALIIFAAALIASKEIAARWIRADTDIDPSLAWGIAAIGCFFAADKIEATFLLGQTDCLMLLGFACALCWMDCRPLLAGTAIGATASIKYLTLIFVPYLLIKKNFRAAISSLLAFIFFMALPVMEVGVSRGAEYARTEWRGLGRMLGQIAADKQVKILKVTMDRSVSITSAVFRLTRSHDLPDSSAALLLVLIFIAVMAGIVFICRHHGVSIFRQEKSSRQRARAVTSLEWTVLIFLAMAFSPQTTARHMVLLLLVFVIAIGLFLAQKAKGSRALLVVAVALMIIGLSLPPFPIHTWRVFSGASWCAVVLILTIIWVGSRTASEMPNE